MELFLWQVQILISLGIKIPFRSSKMCGSIEMYEDVESKSQAGDQSNPGQ